jgi:protein arginine kinase activator
MKNMKCEKCGKNVATYHYKSNINGKVTEMHLCPECASKAGIDNRFFGNTDNMFDSMFNGMFNGFFGNSRTDWLSPFGGFGGLGLMMPTMLMPKFELYVDDSSKVKDQKEVTEKTDVDPEMAKRRELNALREQMKNAVEAEEFEKAAEIRDKIHNMEKEN